MANAIPVPENSRQIAFHELLVIARHSWLIDAVKHAIGDVDPNRLRSELVAFVPADVHQLLASAEIPDEYVFPLPVLLEAKPTLVGYYRLLLGSPQKTFYGTGSGMGKFKSMEESGSLNKNQAEALPSFCAAMSTALADMVRQLSSAISRRDLTELPVMTLGQRFQGANNNIIGQEATKGVFRGIKDIVHTHIVDEDETTVTIRNPLGVTFRLVLASDPDVRIQEVSAQGTINRLALEIKGGADASNQFNRIGEAEKSHIKAKAEGYRDFWTVIRTNTLEAAAQKQSPTTMAWFDVVQVLGQDGPDWVRFASEIAHVTGVPNPISSTLGEVASSPNSPLNRNDL